MDMLNGETGDLVERIRAILEPLLTQPAPEPKVRKKRGLPLLDD